MRVVAGDDRVRVASVEVVDVPAPVVNNTFVAYPTPQTYAVLARYGYVPGRCRPAG